MAGWDERWGRRGCLGPAARLGWAPTVPSGVVRRERVPRNDPTCGKPEELDSLQHRSWSCNLSFCRPCGSPLSHAAPAGCYSKNACHVPRRACTLPTDSLDSPFPMSVSFPLPGCAQCDYHVTSISYILRSLSLPTGDLYIAGLSASSAPISRRLWRIRNIPPPDILLQQQQQQAQGHPDPQAGSGPGPWERSSAPAGAITNNNSWGARPSASGNSNRTSTSGVGAGDGNGGIGGSGYGLMGARSSADGALGEGGGGAGGGEAGALVPMTRAEVTVLAVGTHLFRWMQVGGVGRGRGRGL